MNLSKKFRCHHPYLATLLQAITSETSFYVYLVMGVIWGILSFACAMVYVIDNKNDGGRNLFTLICLVQWTVLLILAILLLAYYAVVAFFKQVKRNREYCHEFYKRNS